MRDDVFRLERRPDGVRFTAALDGGKPARNDADHNWELVDASPEVAPDTVLVLERGSFPDQRIGVFAGRAGRQVTAVEVVPEPGVDVPATVTGGYFVAAWRGGELGSHPGAQVRLHLADGSTRTIDSDGWR